MRLWQKRIAELEQRIQEALLDEDVAFVLEHKPDEVSISISGDVGEALVEARKIQKAEGRAEALAALIPYLSGAVRAQVLQEALKAAREIQDTNVRSQTLTELVPYVLEVARAIGDRQAEGEAHDSLGFAHVALSEFPRAVEHYKRAISIARQLNDRYAEAIRLQNLGMAFLRWASAEPDQSTSLLSQATDALHQALELLDALEDDPLLRARIRYHLSRCRHQLGRWREAITLLEQARTTFTRRKARPELAHVLLELGQIHEQIQDFESAYIYLKDALRLFRRIEDTDGIAVTQEALGSLALQTARPSEAVDSLKEARRGYTALRRRERVRAVDDLLRMAYQAHQPTGG
jgi:tetratricopeptide (TPR) repeat protein